MWPTRMGADAPNALLLAILASLLIAGLAQQASEDDSFDCGWDDLLKRERLPVGGVAPSAYRLELDVPLEEPFEVEGRVEVELEVANATRCVMMHARGPAVRSVAALEPNMTGSFILAALEFALSPDRLLIEFPSALPTPKVTIAIEFNYTLQESPTFGLWRSQVDDGKNGMRWLATTQFQPSSARRAFPCFDEPQLKAEFQVNLTTPASAIALSTMPIESMGEASNGSSRVRHVFKKTPKMPIYTLAFVVGHLHSRSKMVTTALGMKRVAVWTVPTRQKEDMEVGLQRMASVLTYMENRTDIPYSLPKLDWVAVPGFGPIGMENWGLHMSLESVILTSQNHSGAVDSLLIDEIVAHEVAHNWWGNLVTNIWREEIWLNEGLASYFQAYGAEAAATGDGHAERFYLRVTVPALLVDQESEGFSHQLTRPGQDRGSYCGAIGLPQATLTYLKGAAVVRMLQAYLDQNITARDSFLEEFLSGPQGDGGPFLRGAQTYLKRHSFGSTNTSDFLAAFDDATGSPVADMMSAWLLNGDYPLVEIMTMSDGGLGVYARQNRFRLSGKLSCSASKARWWIPMRYKLKSSPEFKWAAVPSCGRVKLATLADANDTIAANAGRSGYYRVRYREPLRTRLLADALDTPPGATNAQLTHVDLAAMLDDAFHMSFAGVQHFDAFLNLTEVLGSRMYTSHTPWAIALPHLRAARDLLRRSATSQACGDDLEQYARERLLGPMVREASNPYSGAGRGLGFSVGADEPLDFRLMHQGLLQEAGNFGGVDVISKSLEIFFGDGAASLHPDLQSVVYNLAVASGNSSAYEQVKSRFLEAEDPHEKKRLLLALTYVPDPGRINETLQLAFNDAVPDRDKFLIFEKNDFTYTYGGLLARGGRSIDAAADFFADFLTSLYNSFGDCDVRLWIKGIARALLDDEKSQNFVQAASQGFQPGQLEELTARNSQWVARYGQSTCRWLRSRMS